MRPLLPLLLILLAPGLATASAPASPAPADEWMQDRLGVLLRAPYPRPLAPHTDLLDGTGDADLDRTLRELGAVEVKRVFRRPPRGWRHEEAAEAAKLERWVQVRWPADRTDLDRVCGILAGHPAVARSERLGWLVALDTLPNDPDFPTQWSLQNGVLGAPRAWDVETRSTRVVALLDSGTDQDHPDLVNNLWINPGEIPGNGVDDEGNGFIDDVVGWDHYYGDNDPEDIKGHGVHVMGIIGAEANNGRQVAGVCWQVPIMNVKVLDDLGRMGPFSTAAGITYAVDNGAAVLNMSFGGSTNYGFIESALVYADANGVLPVAAAGNNGNTVRQYPAFYPEVMGIIATDQNDQKPSWSTYGSWCDMAAPGDKILSTWLNGGTRSQGGTSASSPHVAGAAALLMEVNPMLDHRDVRYLLHYSAVDLGATGKDPSFGWGRLDLEAAVQMARGLRLSTNATPPGTSVTAQLDFPAEPGFLHVLLVGRNGRTPGFSLSNVDPSDTRRIALNPDWALWNFLITHPTGGGVFLDFVGVLDAAGQDVATLNVPPGPLFQGLDLDFVALTFDPANPTAVSSRSASNRLTVQ